MEKKITKKQFIETMQQNNHIFFGLCRRECMEDEIMLAIDNFIANAGIVEERKTEEVHATYLLFTGGSRLLLNQTGKHSFYRLDYNGYTVLSFIRENLDYSGNTDIHACYYLIKAQ